METRNRDVLFTLSETETIYAACVMALNTLKEVKGLKKEKAASIRDLKAVIKKMEGLEKSLFS